MSSNSGCCIQHCLSSIIISANLVVNVEVPLVLILAHHPRLLQEEV